MGVSPNRAGEPPRVPAVVWGARGRASIPRLGMEGKDRNTAIPPTVHDRSGGAQGRQPGVPAGPVTLPSSSGPSPGPEGGTTGSPRTVPSGASTPARGDGDPPSIPAKNGGEGGVDRMKALFSEPGPRTASPPDVPSVPVSVLPGPTPYGGGLSPSSPEAPVPPQAFATAGGKGSRSESGLGVAPPQTEPTGANPAEPAGRAQSKTLRPNGLTSPPCCAPYQLAPLSTSFKIQGVTSVGCIIPTLETSKPQTLD